MIYALIFSLVFVAICVMLLGIKVFFTKNGTFPETHIESNKNLKEKGITCIKNQDWEDFNKKNIFEIKN